MKRILFFVFLLIFMLQLAAAIEVYSEDFEDGVIPSDWSQEYVNGEVNWQIHDGGQNDHPPAAYEGNFNAWFFDNSIEGNMTKLVSPEFALTTHSKLSFWYVQDSWTSYQDYLRVYYRSSVNEDWELLEYFAEEENEWTQVILDLPEPSSTYSIAFEGEANWGYGVCIDNIVVEDCVFNILVWDNDNNSYYIDPNTGQNYNCENSITMVLDANDLEYELVSALPRDLYMYDVIMIELGLYCVG